MVINTLTSVQHRVIRVIRGYPVCTVVERAHLGGIDEVLRVAPDPHLAAVHYINLRIKMVIRRFTRIIRDIRIITRVIVIIRLVGLLT